MDTIKTRLFAYLRERPDHAPNPREVRYLSFSWIPGPNGTKRLFEPGWHDVELELAHVFKDQWNTECGKRVFDWMESIDYSGAGRAGRLVSGHFLEITDEMREVRKATLACGWCGSQTREKDADPFCLACIGGPHLDRDKLHLLRRRSMDVSRLTEREELTEGELARLLAIYEPAQKEARKKRELKRIADTKAKLARDLENAKIEHDGQMWLIDRGFDVENVIFYGHKGVFSFGWRRPVTADEKSRLLDVLSEFPFDYEFKSKSEALGC